MRGTLACLWSRRSRPWLDRRWVRLQAVIRIGETSLGVTRPLAFEMIDELINDFQIDSFERPKRLANLSLPIDLDERLPLAGSGFRCRKNFKVKRITPRHSVVQLSEHVAQNWSLSFAEETVPKLAMMFKVPLCVMVTPYSPCQVIGMVKVGWRLGDGAPVPRSGPFKKTCRPVGQLQSALW